MPCSCGNTTCPCGIPCCCSEESCKCDACAIALQRLCKICNKPLITDIQTDKSTCSCFEVDSAALTLGNGDNSEWRIGNIPLPADYVHGQLIVNMMIPIPCFPPLTLQLPINSKSSPPLIQTDSRNILPSDMHVATSLPSGEDPGIPSTAELSKSSEQSSYHASSGICSTAAQNAEISCKETCPSLGLQSTDEEKPANRVQSTKSEIEGRATVQGLSFYLPSIRIGNISYPVGLKDPVWKLPNPENPNSMMIRNPFCSTRPAHTIQTMTNLGKNCLQQDSNLNNSNGLALEDNITILQMNGQGSEQIKITEQSDSGINNEHAKFDASSFTGTGSEFSFHPSSGNSIGPISPEKLTPCDFNTLPSNEILGNYLMHDKTLDDISTDSSLSGMPEVSSIQSQPACSAPAFASLKKTSYRAGSFTGEGRQNINSRNPHQIPSTTPNIPGYFNFPNTTNLQWLLNKNGAQSSEENEYPQSGNFGSASVNDKRNEELDSIPLYIDPFTTQKMERLLKAAKNSSARSPLFSDVTFPRQNSDANVEFSNSIYRVE